MPRYPPFAMFVLPSIKEIFNRKTTVTVRTGTASIGSSPSRGKLVLSSAPKPGFPNIADAFSRQVPPVLKRFLTRSSTKTELPPAISTSPKTVDLPTKPLILVSAARSWSAQARNRGCSGRGAAGAPALGDKVPIPFMFDRQHRPGSGGRSSTACRCFSVPWPSTGGQLCPPRARKRI